MLTIEELELLDELIWGHWPWIRGREHNIHTEEDVIIFFNRYPKALEDLKMRVSEELVNKVMLLTVINN